MALHKIDSDFRFVYFFHTPRIVSSLLTNYDKVYTALAQIGKYYLIQGNEQEGHCACLF